MAPDFYGFNPDGAYYFSSPCYSPDGSGVLWYNRPPGVLGEVRLCVSTGGNVIQFSLAIDPDAGGASWYTGTGDAPSDTVDLWSVAAHEFGHVTGFYGHFSESSSVCDNNSSRHTMCSPIYGGTERQRTLNTHDEHTFSGAY